MQQAGSIAITGQQAGKRLHAALSSLSLSLQPLFLSQSLLHMTWLLLGFPSAMPCSTGKQVSWHLYASLHESLAHPYSAVAHSAVAPRL